MTILSLSLFGSRARGDNGASSDVDILAIVNDQTMEAKSISKANIAFYPIDFLSRMYKEGDLFALHLKMESIPIYDPQKIMEQLNDSFIYKKTYKNDRENAIDCGFLLIKLLKSNKEIENLNKKIAWCVRTTLISEFAELRNPLFSAKSLSQGNIITEKLISVKDISETSEETIENFSNFLTEKSNNINNISDISINDAYQYFRKRGNTMAIKILRNRKYLSGTYQ